MTTETNEIVWRPTPEVAERSRIARFMRAQRIGSLAELQRRSVADPEWYWDAVVRDLGCALEPSLRPRARRLARRAVAAVVPGRPAELHGQLRRPPRGRRARRQARGRSWEGEDGAVAHADLRELARGGQSPGQRAQAPRHRRRATRSASSCRCRRRRRSPRWRWSRIGAIYTPCFSGFGARRWPRACRTARRKLLITADGFYRRGQIVIPMKEAADEAVAAVPDRSQHVHRLPAPRARDPVDGGPRPLVARGRSRGSERPCRGAAGRGRSPVPDHLHVGDDGTAEGRRAHPRRLPHQDRARLRPTAWTSARATGCSGSPISAG